MSTTEPQTAARDSDRPEDAGSGAPGLGLSLRELPVQRSGPFVWPAPPFPGYPSSEPLGGLTPCEVEGLNGSLMKVKLVAFDVPGEAITVQAPGARSPMTLRMAQFRRLTLTDPLQPDDRGAVNVTLKAKSYRLRLRSGPVVEGKTLGQHDLPIGLFLYEPTDRPHALRRVFVPRASYDSASLPSEQNDLIVITAAGERLPSLADAERASASAAMMPKLTLKPPTAGAGTVAASANVGTAPSKASAPSGLPSNTAASTAAPSIAAPAAQDGTARSAADAAEAPTTPAPPAAPRTRQEQIGELLSLHQITKAEELHAAVERQAKMPMVRMGEALIALQLITEVQLQEALQLQRADRSVPLGELMVKQGWITAADLQMALVRKMGYPEVNVQVYEPATDAMAKVPYPMASRLKALPLMLKNGRMVVAMANAVDAKAIDELEFAANCKIVPALADADALKAATAAAYQKMGAEVASAMASDEADNPDASELLASLEQQTGENANSDEPQIEQSDNSLVRLINSMIQEAQMQGVSDIHIESQPGRDKVRIRFRRDGVLRPYLDLPHTYRNALIARIKIMCDLDISEKRKPQDGKIAFGKFVAGSKLELRVATIPTVAGLEDCVMRLLASAKPLPIDEIGLSPRNLALVKEMADRPYGMFLCVGPTGSGKTTTLHSALGYINTPERKIWTAEDPVEITQPGLRQVQVNPKIDWTFAKALRAFLRADPDVIMVGEIRDAETAEVACESSLTGHLVLSTLHTNSAPETVTRLLDMGMDPFNFADALLGVLAQRLVRRICKDCKTEREATEDEIDELLNDYLHAFGAAETKPERETLRTEWLGRWGKDGKFIHYSGTGCARCSNTGYRGRAALHELMEVTRGLRALIQNGKRVDDLLAHALGDGMRTLRQDGIEKVMAGITTIGEVRASSNSH